MRHGVLAAACMPDPTDALDEVIAVTGAALEVAMIDLETATLLLDGAAGAPHADVELLRVALDGLRDEVTWLRTVLRACASAIEAPEFIKMDTVYLICGALQTVS